MTLRYLKAQHVPRVQKVDSRGQKQWTYDYDAIEDVRIGISVDRTSRAELRGDVEIEVYNIRLPAKLAGIGPGGRIIWDGSEWDYSSPPFIRSHRTHSVRHTTVQARRRPFAEGRRD